MVNKPKDWDLTGPATEEEKRQIEEIKNEYRREINSRPVSDYIHIKKGRVSGLTCPLCNSGQGKGGTGAFQINIVKGKYKHVCQSCGGFARDANTPGTDTLGALMLIDGLSEYEALKKYTTFDFSEALAQLREGKMAEMMAKARENIEEMPETAEESEPEIDYTSYFRQISAHNDFSYLQARGISPETQKVFWVGYDSQWIHPKVKRKMEEEGKSYGYLISPRCIIPTGKSSYLARDTRADVPENQKPYVKSKVGKMKLFNTKNMGNYDIVFVAEGEIDAMSVYEVKEVSAGVVGLGSTSMVKAFIDKVRDLNRQQVYIIMLDNDEPGRTATSTIESAFNSMGVRHIIGKYTGDDANAALVANRELFKTEISKAYKKAVDLLGTMGTDSDPEDQEPQEPINLKKSAAECADMFLEDVQREENRRFYPTGFNALDALLDGGLYAGLYCIGAISSLGKTTFCLQVIDQIAQQGHDALIFSLEMATKELVAKSLSRESYNMSLKKCGGITYAKSTRGLLSGSSYDKYTAEEMDVIKSALGRYKEYAGNIYIHEGVGNIGVKQIAETVENHIKETGKRPVVLIDYLQIIAPYDTHMTDKQSTDKAVLELKRLSRDFNIPVIGISSFNRNNYTEPVNMSSFKESGAIEYSSDVLLGLQYLGMDYQKEDTETKRPKRIKELLEDNYAKGRRGEAQGIHIKVLKNRNGAKGDCCLNFYPMFNCFEAYKEQLTSYATIESSDPFKKETPTRI